MADRLLLANGTDKLLLADGSSFLLLAAQSDATATPAVIAVAVSLPAATATGGEVTATPAVIAAPVSLPAANASGNAVASPAVIAATASLPVATASGSGAGTPAVIAVPVTLPAPSIALTVLPAVIAVAVTLPTPDPHVTFESSWGPNPTTAFPAGAPTSASVLPETAVQLITATGTHVAWVELGQNYGWRRELSGPGSGQVTVQRDDPLLSSFTFDRRLAFWLRGEWVHTALIEPRTDNTVDPGEEAAQTATFGGRGSLAVLARMLVRPLREDLRPVQDAVRFNFAHPDFDDSTWDASKNVSGTDPGVDGPSIPDGWYGHGQPIWGPSGTAFWSPGGSCYFRRTFTLATDVESAELQWAADNKGTAYLDGARIDELADIDHNNYRRTHKVQLGALDAGEHTLAFKVFNQGPAIDPGNDLNPGWLRFTLYELDGDGTPDTPLAVSSSLTKVLEYPDDPPGWKIGAIVNWLLDAEDAAGGPTILRGYSKNTDSDHIGWPVVEELTFPIGNTLLQAVEQLAENYIDMSMDPTQDRLLLWNKGERGSHTSVQLPDGYTSVNGCLQNLRHSTEPPYATHILARWRDGWTSRSVAGTYRAKHIQLPQVESEDQAQAILADLLAIFGSERTLATAVIHPRTESQRPWGGFHEADWLDLPGIDGTLEEVRVQAIAVTVDVNGLVRYELDAGDEVWEADQRFHEWLGRLADGALGGRTRQAQAFKLDQAASAGLVQPVPIVFDRPATVTDIESHPWPADRNCGLAEFEVQLQAVQGSTTTVTLEKNGTTVATVAISAGDTYGTARELATKIVKGDLLTAVCNELGFALVATARFV